MYGLVSAHISVVGDEGDEEDRITVKNALVNPFLLLMFLWCLFPYSSFLAVRLCAHSDASRERG